MPTILNPSAVVTPKAINVMDLFDGNWYIVPDYQREFSWTIDEFEQLWNDVIRTYENNIDTSSNIVRNPTPHFIGAIVVQQPAQDGLSYREEVIDGQQRLATLS